MAKEIVEGKGNAAIPVSKEFENTSQISVPPKLLDQIVGQEKAVEIVRKAAAQKRNVLLVGIPGTGKSLLAQAMSEVLPVSELKDILVYPNHADPNTPRVRIVKAGEGKKIVEKAKFDARAQEDNMRLVGMIFPLAWLILNFVFWRLGWISDIVYAATLVVGFLLFIGFALGSQVRIKSGASAPKLLVDNSAKKIAPFLEATGARAGALLGDVRHDPLQCFVESSFVILRNGVENKISFENLWNEISSKYPELVEKHENDYEAIVFPKEENVYAYSFKDGKVILSRIYSMNKRSYDGKVIDIKSENKILSVTPEHKIVTKSKSKEAEKISKTDSLFILSTEKAIASAVA